MKNIYGSREIRKADGIAAETLAIPGVVLMENAGRGAAEFLARRFPDARSVAFLCGPGNNGGDGFVAARHLHMRGMAVRIVATADVASYRNDAVFAATAAERCGLDIRTSETLPDEVVGEVLRAADVVVDALLGTGAKGDPRGEVARLIRLGNEAGRPVLALDLPSGVDADTGEIAAPHISAAATVTFHAPKAGLFVAPGSLHSGEIAVADIGAPLRETLPETAPLVAYDADDIPALLPRIPRDAHKGSRGAVLVVGGSAHYRGAPLLAARAAFRAGAGVVYLAVPDFMAKSATAFLPEAVCIPLPEKDGAIRFKTLERELAPWIGRCGSLVFGPGVGRSSDAERAARWLHHVWSGPLLFDADALYHLGNLRRTGEVGDRRGDLVITPHIGEAAHLLGAEAEKIGATRLSSCRALAHAFGVTLLKGPHTLVADGGETRVVCAGGPALAVAGSGDVLSGTIGAYLAAGLPTMEAATLGALVHGAAGDVLGGNCALAAEIADAIGRIGRRAI